MKSAIVSSVALVVGLFTAGPVSGSIPDEIFLRHGRELVVDFLEAQSRLYGEPLRVDLDSLLVTRFPDVGLTDLSVHPHLSAALHAGGAGAPCRRIEGFLIDRHARAVFFVRVVGQRFRLARTCTPGDERPPRLVVELPGPRFEAFADAELIDGARPLIENLVRDRFDGARLDPESFTVRRPWLSLKPYATDFQNIYDYESPHDCRRVTVQVPALKKEVTVTVDVTYDADEALPKVPAAYQSLFREPSILRQFRFALVRGCGWWARDAAPAVR